MLEISFSLLAFLTSLLTAVVGIGGGLVLIALMPGFIPAAAIIPVHSVVQLVSNSSRAMFDWRSIRWEFVTAFVVGSVVGVTLAARFLSQIDLQTIPLFIASFILLNVWAPGVFKYLGSLKGEFFSIGLIQTGLGMIGGATGPLGNSSLLRKGLSKDQVVTTSAVMMSITHFSKIVAFGILGVSVVHWWKLLLGMCTGVILGSWIGTRFRRKVDEKMFKRALSWLLTGLALRMIWIALSQ